ncbi:MAG: anti-sigma B factor antagonist [Gammaproteobacteria bacterium]|nr:MAG: anti-sigma B factor antagonist [Gammaproteobacteria bacterium]
MNNYQLIQSDQGQYQLTGVLTKQTVTRLWQQRNELIAKENNLIIDLAGVTHSDSAGLALLTCLQKEAIHAKQSLSFINYPLQIKQLIELSHLEDILNPAQGL